MLSTLPEASKGGKLYALGSTDDEQLLLDPSPARIPSPRLAAALLCRLARIIHDGSL
jgi:hypothetical protein